MSPALREALAQLAGTRAGRGDPARHARPASPTPVQEVDPVQGGIGHAPKFPQHAALRAAVARVEAPDRRRRSDAVDHHARRMCQGGIYDHLGGGFARYATDDEWLVPHFEKMLYDNAAARSTC